MKKKTIIIIVIVAIVIAIVVFLYNKRTTSQIDQAKTKKVDELYAIWKDVAGTESQMLTDNEVKTKKEIYDKLMVEEIDFLTEYSTNFRTMKREPNIFTPTSILMVGYLAQNFQKAREIAAKTSMKDYFDKLGVNINARMDIPVQ